MTTYSAHSDLLALYASLNNLLGNMSEPVFSGTGAINDCTLNTIFLGTSDIDYKVQIDAAATPDTFKFLEGAVEKQTGVAITGTVQKLSNGVTVTFANTTGHTLADAWSFTATTADSDDERAYANAWLNNILKAAYTVPISSPSETVLLAEAHYAIFLILKAHKDSAYYAFLSQANKLANALVASEELSIAKTGGPVSNSSNIQVQFSRGRYDSDNQLLGRGTSNDGKRGSLDDW